MRSPGFLSSLLVFVISGLSFAEQPPAVHKKDEPRALAPAAAPKDVPCYTAALQRAYELKAQMDKSSTRDRELLWQELQQRLRDGKIDPSAKTFRTVLKARLKNDREQMTALYKEMLKQPSEQRGTWPFKTSLGKLAGMASTGKSYKGILEEAEEMLSDEALFTKKLSDIPLELKDYTPFKTLLLYANLVAMDASDLTELAKCERYQQLKLMFPTELPSWATRELSGDLSLFCGADRKKLIIPNNGYVFGGDKCERGGDCSSFCGEVTSSSRQSTETLSLAAKYLKNGDESALSPAEKARFKDALKEGLDGILKQFVAIDPVNGTPGAGDLVVWRFKRGGGHAAIYDRPAAGKVNTFVGVELNRDDDKTDPRYREGIGVNDFLLRREDADVFILRRRPH